MLNFVIQKHTKQGEPTHWDLMLEQDNVLKTYRLNLPPEDIAQNPAAAAAINDHQKRFLTYEGPVNKGLGQVKIADKGTYKSLKQTKDQWDLILHGQILKGTYQLIQAPNQTWSFKIL